MTEPIGFAVVGLGYGSTRLPLLTSTPGVRLAAVVDASAERAAAVGEKYGVPSFSRHTDVLDRDDVDVVAVYTPSGAHLPLALDIASAGKHLMLTKPMEVNLDRSDAIISACEKAGVQLFGEFYLRYEPGHWRLKRAIDTGALGSLILGEFAFKCYRNDDYYRSDGGWRQTWELNGGGVVMNQALHAIDMLSWCLGGVRTVRAITGTYSHQIEVEDTAAALMTTGSGAMATLTGTSTYRTTSGMDDMYGGGYTTRAEVNGDLGSVSLVDDAVMMQEFARGSLDEMDERTRPANAFEDVARVLTTPGYTSATLARTDDMRAVVEIAMAIYESARTGETVPVGSAS
jgi:UDP-N-acetyl-2-amino-2-deoxyglucuronate dehydrogenase